MNEFEARNYILEKGKNIKSSQELIELIEEVKNNFNNGYGTAARSVGAIAACVAKYLSSEMGLTGFQAGCAMWDFIYAFMYPNNKCGMRLINYDDMLYPQYYDNFHNTAIPKYTWEAIQKQAKENLKKDTYFASPSVAKHWQSIVDGQVPFGYTVKE